MPLWAHQARSRAPRPQPPLSSALALQARGSQLVAVATIETPTLPRFFGSTLAVEFPSRLQDWQLLTIFSVVVSRQWTAMDRQKPKTPDGKAEPTPSRPYLLPADLPKALTWLSDGELETLLIAVGHEQRRRSLPADKRSSSIRVASKAATEPRPRIGQINAIRAALKASIKPAKIAKQFGVTMAVVAEVAASPVTGGH